jgi:hypothetical protein
MSVGCPERGSLTRVLLGLPSTTGAHGLEERLAEHVGFDDGEHLEVHRQELASCCGLVPQKATRADSARRTNALGAMVEHSGEMALATSVALTVVRARVGGEVDGSL